MAEWNLLPHEEAKLLNVARDEALIAHAVEGIIELLEDVHRFDLSLLADSL